MSIATDEADKKYPAPTDADDPMYKYVEAIAGYPSAKRQGYIAGRTAKPTEAETWVIARALYEYYADLEYSPEVPDDEWERYKSYYDKTPMKCYEFTIARKALTATRKAVTE